MLLRMVRTLRLLRFVKGFDIMVFAFQHIIPATSVYFLVTIFIYYIYAIIGNYHSCSLGMECFSGLLERGNEKLKGTSYDVMNYYINNFDTLPNAMVVLWEQQINNNWCIQSEGTEAAYNENTWIRFYYIIWTVIINYIVLNSLY